MKNILNKIQNIIGRFMLKSGGVLVSIAMTVLITEVNSTCTYVLYQPHLPKNAEKFKKD